MKPTDFVGKWHTIGYGSRTIKHYMDEDCVVSYYKGLREGIIIIKTRRKYIAYYYNLTYHRFNHMELKDVTYHRFNHMELKDAINDINSMRQPEILLTDEVIKRAVLEAL